MPRVTQGVADVIPDRVQESYLLRVVAIFAAIVVVIGAVGVVGYLQAEATIEENAREELLATTQENAEALMSWTTGNLQQTGLISNSEALAGDDEARMNAYLDSQYAKLSPAVVDLSVVDVRSGEVLASTTDGDVSETVDRVVAAGQESHDDPSFVGMTMKHQWQGDGSDVVAHFSPVPGATDRVLVYTVETAPAEARITGADGSITQLVYPDGTVGFDSSGQLSNEPYPVEDSAALERARAGESGVVVQSAQQGLMDERHLVGFVSLDGGLFVFVHQPTASAFALGDQVGTIIAAILVVTLGGFVGLGVLTARSTVRPIQNLSEKVRELGNGNLGVDLDTSRRDEIGSVYEGVAELRDDLVDQRNDAERYGEVMNVAATGDLTARMDADSDSRDMQTIATSYNGMMDELAETVVTVRSFSDDVASLSEEVAASADEVSRASQEVSTSVQQIAEGANDQNESLFAVSEEIDNMTASIQQVAASADELAEYSRRTTAKGDEGREAASEALTGIDEIRTETERTVEEMEQLDDQMAEIGDIVDVISDIAEQTNILALNANIEAARAGEAGKGFAVVSNEVKSLAEETQTSAQQIESRIESLQDQQQSVLDGMERMRNRVEDGSDSVDAALDSFEEMIAEIDETAASVEEINDATSRQAESSQDILTMSEDATSISEETSAEAQNVSAAAEEQTSTLAEVSNGVDRLAENATELRNRLDQFEVDGGRDRSPADTEFEWEGEESASSPSGTDGTTASAATDGGTDGR